MPRSSLRSAMLFGVLLGAAAVPSLAASIQHEGVAQSAAPLSTYGMQVDAERALRGVAPAGWQIVVEPGSSLNGRVSWSPTDTWLDVLERIAERSQADVRINWDAQEVFVNAAKQPAAEPVAVAKRAALALESTESSNTEAPVVVQADTAPVATLSAEPLSAPVASDTSEVKEGDMAAAVSPAGPARAFNRTPLREPLEALAKRHGLTLIYDMGDVALPGPVTLMLEDDLKADVELLNRALGPSIRLEIIEYRADKELVVSPGYSNSFVSLPGRPIIEKKPPLFARIFGKKVGVKPEAIESSSKPALAANAEATPAEMVESVAVTATAEPVAVAPTTEVALPVVPETLVLELAQGERLSSALDRLLQSRGWKLVWRATVDLVAATPARVEGASLTEILEQVLPQLGLAADLYNPSRTAAIRNVQETATQGAP